MGRTVIISIADYINGAEQHDHPRQLRVYVKDVPFSRAALLPTVALQLVTFLA